MNVENAWQFAKVYEGDVDTNGDPLPEFYIRRNEGFTDTEGHRKSKHTGNYLYHMWDGKRMNKAEARREILMKNCRELSLITEAYGNLKALVDDGVNVQILGYDAREYDGSLDPNGKKLKEMLNDVSLPFCQEFSLAAMLMGINLNNNIKDKEMSKSKDQFKLSEEHPNIVFPVIEHVKAGFLSREEIIDRVSAQNQNSITNINVREKVEEMTDGFLNGLLEDQASWPKITDCDKIDTTFSALEKAGIIARQNFTDSWEDGMIEIKKLMEASSSRGFVFYHTENTEFAVDTGLLQLTFGSAIGSKKENIKIGKIVCDILKEQGLSVEWEGTAEASIDVPNFDWKKRR